jgi:hypothetical protein
MLRVASKLNMLSVIMLYVVMLSVVMLSVVMLNVVEPFYELAKSDVCDCKLI